MPPNETAVILKPWRSSQPGCAWDSLLRGVTEAKAGWLLSPPRVMSWATFDKIISANKLQASRTFSQGQQGNARGRMHPKSSASPAGGTYPA